MLKPLSQDLQNVTIFGALVFKEVIKLKWGHSGGPWSNTTGVFVKRKSGHRDIHRGDYMRTKGRDSRRKLLGLKFSTSELFKNEFLLLKPPNLWLLYFLSSGKVCNGSVLISSWFDNLCPVERALDFFSTNSCDML